MPLSGDRSTGIIRAPMAPGSERDTRHGSRLLPRLALLVGAIVLALVAAEMVFRWFGPDPGGTGAGKFYTPTGVEIPVSEIANFLGAGGYMGGGDLEHPYGRLTPSLNVKQGYDRPRWDYFDADGCIDVVHSSRGFRDEEFPVAKPAGEFRVLALGDSFTWGSGVPAELAWPHVLELALKERGPAQVVNCGFACGTYNPTGYDAWMKTDGLLLDPDLVIVGLCLNDMEPRTNAVPMLSYVPPKFDDEKFESFSAIVRYVRWSAAMREAQRQKTDFAAVVREAPGVWNAVQGALRDLKSTCDGEGIELVVAVFPMLSDLDAEPYPYAGLIRMVQEFCQDAGIHCVDTSVDFVGRDDEMDLWAHVTDQHPNDVGHRLFADRIFAFLQDEQLLR